MRNRGSRRRGRWTVGALLLLLMRGPASFGSGMVTRETRKIAAEEQAGGRANFNAPGDAKQPGTLLRAGVGPLMVTKARIACDAGDMEACVALGIAYEIGKGGPEDDAGALGCYRKACAAGNSKGCVGLGSLY